MVRTYKTPAAFKVALETRLKQKSHQEERPLHRIRQLLIMDRLLARLFSAYPDSLVLKGGLALELRIDNARTTKDVDLRMIGPPGNLLVRIQAAVRSKTEDFLAFEIQEDPHHPDLVGDGIRYEGHRFKVQARLAGRSYGSRFGLDIAFGDPIYGDPEDIEGENTLDFIGIAPVRYRVYPVETHIAEKLHAYTLPRPPERPNSRFKDLPDIVLLSSTTSLHADRLRGAIQATFSFRGTHAEPKQLPPPPERWRAPYPKRKEADELPWPDLDALFGEASSFLNPVLQGTAGRWSLDEKRWIQFSEE